MTRQVVHNHTGRIAFGFSTNGEKWVEKVTLARQEGREDSCLDLPLCRQHLPAEDRDKKQKPTRTHKRLTFPCIQPPPPHHHHTELLLLYFCFIFFYGPICYYIPWGPLSSSVNILPFTPAVLLLFFAHGAKRELSSFLTTGFWQSRTALSSSCVFFCYPFVYFQLAHKRFCIIISYLKERRKKKDFAISLYQSNSHCPNVRKTKKMKKREGKGGQRDQFRSNLIHARRRFLKRRV